MGKAKAKDDPAAELEVLFPDVDLTVRDPDTGEDVAVTVRELRFLEGMKVRPIARPLVVALADVLGDGGEMALDAVEEIMSEHAEAWLALIAAASDRDADWIGRLSDADGDAVAEAMWNANRNFLLRRVVTETAARRRSASASQPSSTPS